MDNAAKALLIAGGILIATLIISISMYLLTAFRAGYEDNSNILKENEVIQFNSFFNKFGGPNTTLQISGADAYNILSFVKEVNSGASKYAQLHINEGGSITTNNFEKHFYYTDTFFEINLENGELTAKNYAYSYNYGNDGLVNQVSING